MARRYELRKQNHVVWPWALFVGLGMVFIAHAPIIPVAVGCLGVILFSMGRTKWRERKAKVRGGPQ